MALGILTFVVKWVVQQVRKVLQEMLEKSGEAARVLKHCFDQRQRELCNHECGSVNPMKPFDVCFICYQRLICLLFLDRLCIKWATTLPISFLRSTSVNLSLSHYIILFTSSRMEDVVKQG